MWLRRHPRCKSKYHWDKKIHISEKEIVYLVVMHLRNTVVSEITLALLATLTKQENKKTTEKLSLNK